MKKRLVFCENLVDLMKISDKHLEECGETFEFDQLVYVYLPFDRLYRIKKYNMKDFLYT